MECHTLVTAILPIVFEGKICFVLLSLYFSAFLSYSFYVSFLSFFRFPHSPFSILSDFVPLLFVSLFFSFILSSFSALLRFFLYLFRCFIIYLFIFPSFILHFSFSISIPFPSLFLGHFLWLSASLIPRLVLPVSPHTLLSTPLVHVANGK